MNLRKAIEMKRLLRKENGQGLVMNRMAKALGFKQEFELEFSIH